MNNIILEVVLISVSIWACLKINEKYGVANKINSKLNINKKWKAYMLATTIFISGSIIFTMTIHIPNIITSLIWGISICLSEKIVSEFKLTKR